MEKNLKTYKITIDPEFATDGEDLGIEMIAFVEHPAVMVKGMAFEESKSFKFYDDTKMRIAAPALIPMNIYRNDDWGEYFVQFTESEIEKIHSKFMKNLTNKDVFNLEHDPEQKVPAYILEAWLVGKNPQADRSYSEFGIDVPTGSLFIVAQVTDREYYNSLVETNRIGFSIEGFLGLKLTDIIKKSKQSMKKNEFIGLPRFNAFNVEKQFFVTAIANTIAVGEPVLVIDDNLNPDDNYTGEVEINDQTVKVENGKITEILSIETETEMAADTPEAVEEEVQEAAETEMGEYPKEEVKMQIDETELMNLMQPKLDEVYGVIADLKAQVETLLAEKAPATETKMAEQTPNRHQKYGSIINFLNKD